MIPFTYSIDYRERLELEYYYVKHCSLYLDILCIIRTLFAVLKKDGALFTEDVYENAITDFRARPTVVKALCLHIAHDCNLACRYCFAEEGEYHGRRALMSFEVGKKALDFLIHHSGARKNLEVDFFGGEPLMNWQVVKDLVAYGRSQEKLYGKQFRFTLTTNGVLLNEEVMEFCNREMANVVLSIDGRKEVHDFMRPFRSGAGSYDMILPKFKTFALVVLKFAVCVEVFRVSIEVQIKFDYRKIIRCDFPH